MATKTTTLSAQDLDPRLVRERNGIPFADLLVMIEKVRQQVPDSEEPTLKVLGVEGVHFVYEHTLTVEEELRNKLDAYQGFAQRLYGLLAPKTPLTEVQLVALRSELTRLPQP